MEAQPFKTAPDGTSKSLFDLNLPEVAPGEGPVALPEPSCELMLEHARFLLHVRQRTDAPANQAPNPEPFVL